VTPGLLESESCSGGRKEKPPTGGPCAQREGERGGVVTDWAGERFSGPQNWAARRGKRKEGGEGKVGPREKEGGRLGPKEKGFCIFFENVSKPIQFKFEFPEFKFEMNNKQ